MTCALLFSHSRFRFFYQKGAEMILNVFIIFFIIFIGTAYPSCPQSVGFKVTQPRYRTVNPDGSASISCEHDANTSSVEDVRLNRLSHSPEKRSVLCQKGKERCENIVMYLHNPNKCLFVLLDVGPDAMAAEYECEFTVTLGLVDITGCGTPTRLRPGATEGQQEAEGDPPPPPQVSDCSWALIGGSALLALLFLYGCVVTCVFIRTSNTKHRTNPENCVYVEMRNAPQPPAAT